MIYKITKSIKQEVKKNIKSSTSLWWIELKKFSVLKVIIRKKKKIKNRKLKEIFIALLFLYIHS